MSRKQRGFTLIEVLAAMAVLMVGLTAVIALVTGSLRMSNSAADQNVTKAIISEAIADIERLHIISATMAGVPVPPGPPIPASDVGLFMETIPAAPDMPSIHNIPYSGVTANGVTMSGRNPYLLDCLKNTTEPAAIDPTKSTLLMWPHGTIDPKYMGGDFVPTTSYKGANAYRVIYRLERHQLWHPHALDGSGYSASGELPESPYVGLYQLTLIVYRDVDRRGGRLEQLTDPVVVFLRDRKDRQ